MQKFASVKTLMSTFRIDAKQARIIRGVVKGTINPEDETLFPQTARWIRQCYHRPWDSSLKMSALNEILGMYGVEALGSGNDYRNGYAPPFEYCNSGDTYNATILLNNRTGQFFVSTCGDVVERNPKLFQD
jgi:hypothetical protein